MGGKNLCQDTDIRLVLLYRTVNCEVEDGLNYSIDKSFIQFSLHPILTGQVYRISKKVCFPSVGFRSGFLFEIFCFIEVTGDSA